MASLSRQSLAIGPEIHESIPVSIPHYVFLTLKSERKKWRITRLKNKHLELEARNGKEHNKLPCSNVYDAIQPVHEPQSFLVARQPHVQSDEQLSGALLLVEPQNNCLAVQAFNTFLSSLTLVCIAVSRFILITNRTVTVRVVHSSFF